MRLLLALASLFCMASASAAPPEGFLDPTYGENGTSMVGFDIDTEGYNHDWARAATIDAQGRVYVVGHVTMQHASRKCVGLTRILPDGQLDLSFGEGGKRCYEYFPSNIPMYPSEIVLDPNGGILVAGTYWGQDKLRLLICRFFDDGALDLSFGAVATQGCQYLGDVVGGKLPVGAPAGFGMIDLAVHGDRIFAVLNAYDVQFDVVRTRLVRLSLDGEIIPYGQNLTVSIFPDSDGTQEWRPADIVVAPDGQLLVSGVTLTLSQVTLGWDMFVASVDPDTGKPDPAFNGNGIRRIAFDLGGGNHDVATTMTLTPDGRIVVVGSARTSDSLLPAVAVVTQSGELDAQFNDGQPVYYNPCVFYIGTCQFYVTGVHASADGKILLTGYGDQDDSDPLFALRLNRDGAGDTSFGPNFIGSPGYSAIPGTKQHAVALVMQQTQPILVGSIQPTTEDGYDFLLARLSDGRLFRDEFESLVLQ